MARKRKPKFSAVKFFLFIVFIGLCAVALIGYVYYQKIKNELPSVSIVENYRPIESIEILDRNDHQVCIIEGDDSRRIVPLNQISNQMQQAMLAAEDHYFFEHHGINFVSIFRALMVNLQAHKVVEGGSTITQQLVKNLFFGDSGRTYDRKIKEALVSYEIEQKYSKEKILEMYLNQVYFGNNAYGIEKAAWKYFDCSSSQLDLAQSAFLACLVKSPSSLGSKSNRAKALENQKEILAKMVEYGYITKTQYNKAVKEKLVFKSGSNPYSKYPYYISYVVELLKARFGENDLRHQGLKVYTNLDPIAQTIAEKTLNEGIAKAPKGISQGALVSINVNDGAVLAMVGGVGDYWKSQFNRASNPHTIGSAFKPFVYLTGILQDKIDSDTIIEDSPVTIKQAWGLPDYSPKNYDHRYLGKITVARAIAGSRNVPAIKIAQLVGVDNIIETAKQAGVDAKMEPNLSIALGSCAISPLNIACAYSTFARYGIRVEPNVIRRIETYGGNVLFNGEYKSDRVFPQEKVSQLIELMVGVVKYGTGRGAQLADRPVAGKTGTADQSRDIWFVGFTPDLVTSTWAGNDQNLPIAGSHVTGGDIMAQIWRKYNEEYYKTHLTPVGKFILVKHEAKKVLAQDSSQENLDNNLNNNLKNNTNENGQLEKDDIIKLLKSSDENIDPKLKKEQLDIIKNENSKNDSVEEINQ